MYAQPAAVLSSVYGVEPRKVARQYLVYFEYFIKYIVDHNNLY
eukprot:SAG31_NODE_4976_length_2823_cov_1.737885_1_plen_42_part_10